MGLREKLKPTENRPPEQQPVASVAVVVPPLPPVVRPTTTECPHRRTRIVEIRSDFDFDAAGKIRYDATKQPLERFEECLWCGEWLTIESEPETEPEPIVSEPDCNFAW